MNDSKYPPPRLRDWRAKGVSFLSVFLLSFSNVAFLCFLLSVCLLSVKVSVSYTDGLVLSVLKRGPRFSAVATSCVPFWCHIFALIV